jgi:hypothetical protein
VNVDVTSGEARYHHGEVWESYHCCDNSTSERPAMRKYLKYQAEPYEKQIFFGHQSAEAMHWAFCAKKFGSYQNYMFPDC